MSEKIARNPDVVIGDVGDGESVLLDVESGRYFGLNRTAAAIWELLDEAKTLDELVAALCATHDVSPEDCRRDVEELLALLRERGIVVAGA